MLSGYDASDRASQQEVGDWTLKCFHEHVPAAVPGIVFLSGGKSDEDATAHLNAMNAHGPQMNSAARTGTYAPAMERELIAA